MFPFKKSKKVLNIVIEDYMIRILEAQTDRLENAKVIVERPIPLGLIENGKITDEVQFFGFMSELVKKYSLKKRTVRFYVPNALVIMRQVEFPSHLSERDEIIDYFSMEVGKSLHFPFKDPVFDIYYLSEEPITEETQFREVKKGVLFAAPREEIQRYSHIFLDAGLHPKLADVNALGVFRYYQSLDKLKREHVYLFVELNVTSINLSIFNNYQLEFLRYQDLDVQLAGWDTPNEENDTINWKFVEDERIVEGAVTDQVMELGRIMNFYRFSMHQGTRQVTDIIVLGDHPCKESFSEKVKEQYNIHVELLGNYETRHGEIDSDFIPALGLAIEGGSVL